MKYGTHNSCTYAKLVWWQRPFAWLLNLTSKCQSKTIAEQLADDVVLFQLQIAKYQGNWHISHGLCIYDLMSNDVLTELIQSNKEVWLQLFLDKNFLLGQDFDAFQTYIGQVQARLTGTNVHLLYAYIEKHGVAYVNKKCPTLSYSEHYWTTSWASKYAESLLDYLPLPKRHARLHNREYKFYNSSDVLMLDFYELPK